MQRRQATRRRFLLGTTATMTALAGCSGGGGGNGDDEDDGAGGGDDGSGGGDGSGDGSGTGDGSGGGNGDATTGAEIGEGTATGDGGAESTPNDSPDPDCTRLEGSPTEYDAAGTSFVFTFDYLDTWEVKEPLEGSGGRSQGVSSPVVSVDGEPESAGFRIGQRFEALTADGVDTEIADMTGGDANPAEVVRELEYDGETVRLVGFPHNDLALFRLFLPHGSGGDRAYYPVEIDGLTSILRIEDGERSLLCLSEIQAVTDRIVDSLRPNPESTIDEQ